MAGERALNLATEEEDGYVDVPVVARLFLPIILFFRGASQEAEAIYRTNIALLEDGRELERFSVPAFPLSSGYYGQDAWLVAEAGRFQEALALLGGRSKSRGELSMLTVMRTRGISLAWCLS